MEMAQALRQIRNLPTAIQRIDYPIHKGQPNPAHGKFIFVGAIPFECTEESHTGTPQIPANRKSKIYDTEMDAILAATNAGVEMVQGCNCTWYKNGIKQQLGIK